jgi:hypothetical protein
MSTRDVVEVARAVGPVVLILAVLAAIILEAFLYWPDDDGEEQ